VAESPAETWVVQVFHFISNLFFYSGDNMKKRILIGAGLFLALASIVVWATNARVMWTPERLAPASIAPGETMAMSVSFTNNGPSNMNSKKLVLRLDGDAGHLVTVGAVSFPPIITNGSVVTVPITISIPASEPIGVVHGELLLLELKPDGSVKEIFSDTLPISIVVSRLSLPPYPDPEENNVTLEGIDIGGAEDGGPNGVRDDMDIYIGLTYPNSAKIREALKQVARAYTPFLLDADDKVKTRENNVAMSNAHDCITYVFNHNLDASQPAGDAIKIAFLNTKERSEAYWKANGKLGGTTDPSGPVLGSEIKARRQAACAFNPNSLPN
jgi:hypothetical protein